MKAHGDLQNRMKFGKGGVGVNANASPNGGGGVSDFDVELVEFHLVCSLPLLVAVA